MLTKGISPIQNDGSATLATTTRKFSASLLLSAALCLHIHKYENQQCSVLSEGIVLISVP
ncbi:UNVERIFIED_CONTAM: hypothetical protein NCL1_20519 [Trichonephila clavipes]